MSIHLKGTIERKAIGTGAWALVSDSGETYELHNSPKDLHKNGLKVEVDGQVRDDVMTLAMIGPVLEVAQFKVLGE